MKSILNQGRQGDLMFIKVNTIPKTAKLVKSGVILHSDTTSHEHKIVGGKLYKTKKGDQFAESSGKTTVTHEEHGTLFLSKGKTKIVRQRQYVGNDMVEVVKD